MIGVKASLIQEGEEKRGGDIFASTSSAREALVFISHETGGLLNEQEMILGWVMMGPTL